MPAADAQELDQWHAVLHAVRSQLDLLYQVRGGESLEEALLREGVERIKEVIAQLGGCVPLHSPRPHMAPEALMEPEIVFQLIAKPTGPSIV